MLGMYKQMASPMQRLLALRRKLVERTVPRSVIEIFIIKRITHALRNTCGVLVDFALVESQVEAALWRYSPVLALLVFSPAPSLETHVASAAAAATASSPIPSSL